MNSNIEEEKYHEEDILSPKATAPVENPTN
jgi:hypothetical protein